MNTGNPTSLRIGMRGNLLGEPCRIAGRVVLGMEEGGETYYWNEFHVVTDAGESMTLVYEVTENGPEWRVFRLFEPDFPITAADAATKKVGDTIYLEAEGLTITVVDESRVYFIEGESPEGVEMGDVANYFNAENGQRMDVVSWTGQEVECYHGQTVTMETVMRAFGVAGAAGPEAFLLEGTEPVEQKSPVKLLVVCATIAVILFTFVFKSHVVSRHDSIKTVPAPALNAPPGRTISIEGQPGYVIQNRDLFQIQEVNLTFSQFRLELSDGSVLITPLQPGREALMHRVEVSGALTPLKAGAFKTGDRIDFENERVTVRELFACKPAIVSPTAVAGFGCLAHGKTNDYLIQWDTERVWLLVGKPVKEGSITAALRK